LCSGASELNTFVTTGDRFRVSYCKVFNSKL